MELELREILDAAPTNKESRSDVALTLINGLISKSAGITATEDCEPTTDHGNASGKEALRPRERLWSTVVAAFVASIPALLVGYTLGFASSALLDLTGDTDDDAVPSDYYFGDTVSGIFAALAPIGGVFGGLLSGPIADRWGRKDALVLCGIPSFIGYLTLSYAHYMPTALGFKALALTGRFLTGVGMGWACMVGPALAPIGALFGAPLSGVLADRWGRKDALVLCGIPYFIGYLTLSYAHYMPTVLGFKALAFTGRFLTGVGMGWAGSVAPVYIGEISSAKLRGLFGAFTQIAVAAGIVLNYGISTLPGITYFYSSLVAAGIIAIFECCVVFLYESPSWLIRHGQSPHAVRVLQWLRGPLVKVKREVERIEAAESLSLRLAMKEMSRRHITVPILVVMFSMFFHQIGGAHVLSTYAAILYEEAGVPNPKITALCAVGGVELLTTLFSILVIDFVGRKLLLVFSSIGMIIGSALLGVHFLLTRPSQCTETTPLTNNSTENLQNQAPNGEFENCINMEFVPLAISSTVLFAVAYSIGWGPVPWVLLSELIPVRVRGAASGIATLVNWGSAAFIIGVYLEYSHAVRDWFAWWTFAVLNLIAAVFAITFVRETKGKTLEDIEQYYRDHRC